MLTPPPLPIAKQILGESLAVAADLAIRRAVNAGIPRSKVSKDEWDVLEQKYPGLTPPWFRFLVDEFSISTISVYWSHCITDAIHIMYFSDPSSILTEADSFLGTHFVSKGYFCIAGDDVDGAPYFMKNSDGPEGVIYRIDHDGHEVTQLKSSLSEILSLGAIWNPNEGRGVGLW
jgi:hypothetical protein